MFQISKSMHAKHTHKFHGITYSMRFSMLSELQAGAARGLYYQQLPLQLEVSLRVDYSHYGDQEINMYRSLTLQGEMYVYKVCLRSICKLGV